VDAFGNEASVPVMEGAATIAVTQMPTYLLPRPGQSVSAPIIDLGINLARQASFVYSGPTKSDLSVLNNGIMETIHAGNPHGDTGHPPIFSGDLPSTPQTLEMDLPAEETINRLLVFGMRADNQFCALLDFDVQAYKDDRWITVDRERTPLAATTAATSPQCTVDTWLADNNMFVCRFDPVKTGRIRIVALRTTLGFAPDELAAKAVRQAWGNAHVPALMLKEIEAYGPVPGDGQRYPEAASQ
jgi:hypothetical protein